MKNVLVFPCGSEIGLEVYRSLADSTHFKLFGGSSVDDHGKFVYENYIPGISYIDTPNFISEINAIIEKYNIDFIIPAHDSAVLKMAENQQGINASVIASAAETCRVCRSKGETYQLFDGLIPTPRVYTDHSKLEYPLFLKPDVGQGSKGTYKVDSKEEVDFYYNQDPSLLALEYLPGKEYTVDCFTDKNGTLLFSAGRERARIYSGISVNSKEVKNDKFKELAEVINSTLSFQGVWFYQVKERSDGELVLMEIAPRIAGTMALLRVDGVNFAQLSLFDKLGFDVDVLRNDLEVEIDRALFARYKINYEYDHVYVDFDDTVIVNGTVNTAVISFLYQSKNQGKKVILVTRHREDVNESLKRFAISYLLFDEIVVLLNQENKSAYINGESSIFIDDSFAERKEVSEALGIPVFSLDAVESLLV